jgi:hypothetical protein
MSGVLIAPPTEAPAKPARSYRRVVMIVLATAAVYGDGLLLWGLHLHGTGTIK